MLSVCLIFLYVLIVAYITGFTALYLIGRLCAGAGKRGGQENVSGAVMAGLVVLTVYAQVFSLFYKVGLLANLLLLMFITAAAVSLRRPLREELNRQRARLSGRRAAGYVFLFLLFAYGTSRGIIHYDTGLYHAQSIRWIEEYGVVKGLGNLHCRLAYNSSSFCLSALFSFSFLGGQSYHCMAGFLALLLSKECAGIAAAVKRKRLLGSDLVRIMGIYYLLTIFDEMVSPASDYFMVLTVFYILIRWLSLVERKVENFLPYALLCLLGVHVMGIKLSAAFILLLTVKPAVLLIRERNGRAILYFLLMGAGILAPYLIRNALISGWIAYPLTFPDLLSVEWKIPKGLADYDAKEIQVWGRGLYDVARYHEPFSSWFPSWFSEKGMVDRLFILAGMASSAVLIPAAAYILVGKKREWYDDLTVAVAVDISFLAWLFSAPLMRYGCVYVYLAAAVTFGGPIMGRIRSRTLWRIVYAGLSLIACYKFFTFGRELTATAGTEYFIWQKDYENFATEPYEIEGHTFYYAAEGDRTGYTAFPSSPGKAEITLRGESIKEGFLPGKAAIGAVE